MRQQYKVLYIVNVPAPYMVNYFNELGKYCELTVIFEKDRSIERDKSWQDFNFVNFKGIILKGISTAVDMSFCPQIIFYLRKNYYDYIFVSSMATPTGIVAIEYMKLRGIPYFLESEGGIPKNGKGFKEKFKKYLMSNATKYLSANNVGDTYFLQYGAEEGKIVRYPFTSIYRADILSEPVDKSKKTQHKNELNVAENKMILTVGQFIYRKGFDVLLRACEGLADDVGVYLIGGEEIEEYASIITELNLHNIHFVKFHTWDKLKKYYQAADLFVLPTREDIWGLVINEAMACGLPVITTNQCLAGTELVKDDENGYIIPINDSEILHEKIVSILEDDRARVKMGEKSIERIQWYTFESMAKVHMDYMKEWE